MSTLVTKNLQIGADGTASNNFTVYQPVSPDGTLRIGNGNSGTTSAQVVLASAGNVGIGTDAPATLLHVSGSETTAIGRIASSSVGAATFNGSGAGLELLAGGMNTTNKYTPAIKFGSTDVDFTTTNPKFGAAIIAEATVTYNTDTTGGMALSFWTSPNNPGTGSGLVERARINENGNLLVGTASEFGSEGRIQASVASIDRGAWVSQIGTVTSRIHMRFRNPNGVVGSISTSASATTYATSSDYRLKHDIAPMTGALAKVAALKPCTYKWNADDSADEGFIAHELAEVCPSAVSGEKDAVDANGNPVYQGIDTSFLVATLTAAIQEQQTIIAQLQADVALLKGAPE